MAGSNKPSRWADALLDRMRQLGDSVADEPVAAVLERGGVDGVNAIMQTLVRTDQPVPEQLPDELKDYLVNTLPLPEWADMSKIRRGQQLFETWGVEIAVCLFCASLPSSYAAAKGVKVLHMTARLDTDPRRRVMETGQFLIDVLTVGGLAENGKGRRTIQRVRLMHAAVRHLIKARNAQKPGTWHADWGTPINQEDLAGTLLAFSYVVAEPLPRLGVQVSTEDAEAYLHLWNVIGHLLGVCDELLVRDIGDATELVHAIRRRQFKASRDGQEMTRALMDLLDEMTPLHRFDDTIPPLIRHLIGNKTADMLCVPKSHLGGDIGRLTRAANWFFVQIFGRPERHDSARYELMSELARPFGHELLDGLLKLERGGERASFALPDHLARRWELRVQDQLRVHDHAKVPAPVLQVGTGDRGASDMGDKGRTDTVKEALGTVARQARTLAERAAKLIGDELPKKVRGEKAAAKKVPVVKGSVRGALANTASATKATAPKAPAKTEPAQKTAAKKAPAHATAKKAAAKKPPAKKAPAHTTTAQKAPTTKAPVKKESAKRVSAKKATAKKATARKALPKKGIQK